MSDEDFSEDDSQFDRHDRFKARREMLNLMVELGVPIKSVRIETPRGVHKADKLRAFVEEHNAKGIRGTPTLGQIDRPPGTGKISGLIEEARLMFTKWDKDEKNEK